MSWPAVYLWNFVPIFAGLAFFYLISSAKATRNKIKIYTCEAEEKDFIDTDCSSDLQELQDSPAKDIFDGFAREELIINGMFTGKKKENYHRACAENLSVIDLGTSNFIKLVLRAAPEKGIAIFSRDHYGTLDRMLDFDGFSGIVLYHAMNSSLKVIAAY